MNRLVAILALTFPASLFPFPALAAQKRAITFDDYIALKAVSDPQLSPDGRWVAYTVTDYSLKDNRGTARVWLAEVATGQTRRLTAGRETPAPVPRDPGRQRRRCQGHHPGRSRCPHHRHGWGRRRGGGSRRQGDRVRHAR